MLSEGPAAPPEAPTVPGGPAAAAAAEMCIDLCDEEGDAPAAEQGAAQHEPPAEDDDDFWPSDAPSAAFAVDAPTVDADDDIMAMWDGPAEAPFADEPLPEHAAPRGADGTVSESPSRACVSAPRSSPPHESPTAASAAGSVPARGAGAADAAASSDDSDGEAEAEEEEEEGGSGSDSSSSSDADVPLAARVTAAAPPRPLSRAAPPSGSGGARPRCTPRPPGTNATEVRLEVVCGGVHGTLVLPPRFKPTAVRVLYAGSSMTPSQFESVCGKDSQKKWRSTLRVRNADGSEGTSVGKWLARHVEPPCGSDGAPAEAAPSPPPPAAAKPPPEATAAAIERLSAQVAVLLDDAGVLQRSHVAAFVQLLAGATAGRPRVYLTAVLEESVKRCPPGAPVLASLVAAEALTPLEAYVEAAAAERDAPLLLRTLRLLAQLPVTLAALQRCGLGKRCNRLQKYSATPPPHADAAAAAEVDKAASALVAKWKAQVSAETASASAAAPAAALAAPPAAKKARVAEGTTATAAAAAPAKPARSLADDDMFIGGAAGKPKPPAAAAGRPAPRVGVLADTEARALASRPGGGAAGIAAAAATQRAAAAASTAAASLVASMPAMQRLAKERAARAAAAADASAQRISAHVAAEAAAAAEAKRLFEDLYPEGAPPVPEIVESAAAAAAAAPPLSSNLASTRKAAAAAAAAAAPVGDGSDAPPAPAPPAASRLKRKRKGVAWAPEAALTQVRLFKKDEPPAGEAAAYPDPATAGLGAAGGDLDALPDAHAAHWAKLAMKEAAVERRSADAWRARLQAATPPPEPVYVPPPLMTAVFGWWCPPLVQAPEWTAAGAPACGEDSTERATQREREAARPPVVYPNLASVPDHPAQGPARAEPPADNSKTPVIVHDHAPEPEPAPPPQQFMLQQQQLLQQVPQQQMGGFGVPVQQPQLQGLGAMMQPQQLQALMQGMMGVPQTSMPMQGMQPQQMGAQQMQQQQPSWLAHQQSSAPVMMQQPPQQAPPPQQQVYTGWDQVQQHQAAQQAPAMSTVHPEWLLAASAAPAAQPPATMPASDDLTDLVRTLTGSGTNAALLQQALMQVGSTQSADSAPSIPAPRPPPGPPPSQVAPGGQLGAWPQQGMQPQAPLGNQWDMHVQHMQQTQQQFVPPPQPPPGPPPSQQAFSAPPPQASFFDQTPLPGSGGPGRFAAPGGGGSFGGRSRTPCRYFRMPRGCNNGNSCRFSHQ